MNISNISNILKAGFDHWYYPMNTNIIDSTHHEIFASDVKSIRNGKLVVGDDDLVIVISNNLSNDDSQPHSSVTSQNEIQRLSVLLKTLAGHPVHAHQLLESIETAVYGVAYRANIPQAKAYGAAFDVAISNNTAFFEHKKPSSTRSSNRSSRVSLFESTKLRIPKTGNAQKSLLNITSPEKLRTKVFESAHWFTAQELSENAGYTGKNPSTQPNKWKKDNKIFAVSRNGKDFFPAYALGDDGKPLPVMKDILIIMTPHKSSLGIATWFACVNSWLGGKMPMSELSTRPNDVVNAALMEINPSEHG